MPQSHHEGVKNEIFKWLEAGIIYPIVNGSWVNPVQSIQNKGGITIVPNQKNELISSGIVIGWRVCWTIGS